MTLRHGIAAIDEDAQVAGKRGRIAGDRRDQGHIRLGDLLRLVLGAGAWRIEDYAVECIQFLEGQRAAEKVALLDGYAP